MIRLGTTSYVLPADILPNVEFLAGKVDDVELVLFESKEASNLPDRKVVRRLGELAEEHHLTYTVHFPLDIWPGSFDEDVRRHSVDTYRRIIRLTRQLPVFSYVLHLTPEGYGKVPSVDVPRWLDQLDRSLAELLERGEVEPSMLSCETLSYPFDVVFPLVERYDTSVTLDIGHIWLMEYDAKEACRTLLPRARVCHLHGVSGGRDHQSLAATPAKKMRAFLEALRAQDAVDGKERVLTMEIFGLSEFGTSTALLEKAYRYILDLRS